MSDILFGRVGSISVIKKGESEATEFKGLRFSFKITKTSEANPNIGNVSIFNLSAESRALLEEPKSQIIVKTGYSGFGVNPIGVSTLQGNDLTEIIYVGDIRLNGISTERNGADIITNLECSTGLNTFNDSKINKSFAKGTTAQQIISSLTDSMGLKPSQLQAAGSEVFLGGFSASGASKDVLSKILKKLGVEWSIQDDELHIVEKTLTTGEELVFLSSETGLIGVPTKRANGSYVFQCLLNPKIRPGKSLSIQSKTITGIFRPRTVDHQGDLDGGAWDTTIEAVEIG